MREIWKEIDIWPNYFISNKGRFKKGEKILKTCPNKKRRNYHYCFHSSKNMRPRAQAVHRLVARHFIPNRKNKPCVNHIDCNTENNDVTNLEWVTHQENTNHSKQLGHYKSRRGEEAGNAKLTEDQVRAIFKAIGKKTHREIAEEFNTNYSNVAHIKRGSRWGHITSQLQ